MKKLLALTLFVFLISLSYGQNSLLWEISGNGLEKPSYLFGTIHVICPDDFFMPEQTSEKLNSCEQLMLEMDITDPTVLQTVQQGMMNPQMKNLKSDLSEEDQEILNKVLTQTLGVGIDQLGILKPWALSTMLSVKLALNCEQPAQYEMEFSKMAGEAKLPLVSLETATEQIAIFENIPYEKQLELLMDGIKNKDEDKALFVEMVAAYKNQDINALYKYILEEGEMEDFSEFLLDNRNVKWIPVIAKTINAKPSFIAVGAGHLAGEKGLIQLLRKEGYMVEPVQ
nr:TraB/GumN family protein [uncultured Carboxylicivirga sp.]